jgi:endoglucanase
MLLRDLTEKVGVSGNEEQIREYIKDKIKDYCDDIKIDVMGNLIAYKKSNKRNSKNVIISAHMDEVGFMVTKITDKGFLKFKSVGGIDDRILLSKKVVIGNEKIKGVIGLKAIHLQNEEERKKPVKISDMYIDIGASSKEEAKKKINLGDYGTFLSNYVEFGDRLVKAKALDDRVGCSIIIELLKNTYPCNIYACFTVQEEVGLRGAMTAAYGIDADLALILECTTSCDVPDVGEHESVTTIGEGPAISIIDRATYSDKRLNNYIKEQAENKRISYQYKRGIFGGNDAGKIHLSKTGIPSCSISVPCRYIHSPISVMSIKDYDNTFKLAQAFLENIENVDLKK